MTTDNHGSHNGGTDLAEVIRAALLPRTDLEFTPDDAAEMAAAYRSMLRDYRQHSLQYLVAGDYRQGAEKSWGAYAESVKSIAADYGFKLSHHGHIIRVSGRLATLAGESNPEDRDVLSIGLSSARSLHQHFYENYLLGDDVTFSAERVSAAIDLMQQRFSAVGG